MMLQKLILFICIGQAACICIEENSIQLTCYNEDYFDYLYLQVTSLKLIDCTITAHELVKCFPSVKVVTVLGATSARMCKRLQFLGLELRGCDFPKPEHKVVDIVTKHYIETKTNIPSRPQEINDDKTVVFSPAKTIDSTDKVYAIVFPVAAFIIIVISVTCCVIKKKKCCVRAEYMGARVDVTLNESQNPSNEETELKRRFDELTGDELLQDSEEETVFDRTFVETPQKQQQQQQPQESTSALNVVEALRKSTRKTTKPVKYTQ